MLGFINHTLMENRDGLVVQAALTRACGHGEPKAALEMIERHPRLDPALGARDRQGPPLEGRIT